MTNTARAVRRPASAKKTNAVKRRKPAAAVSRKPNSPSVVATTIVPLIFIGAILLCLGLLLTAGYRTVTASSFFNVKKIDVFGNSKVATSDVEKIVLAEVEKNGVWNADITEIKASLEKFAYIKSAVVSRILPDEMSVKVEERIPKAAIKIGGNDFWVDDEAVILGPIGKNDVRPPFVLRGWDEAKTEKAQTDNRERVRLYNEIKKGWTDAGLAKIVNDLDLSDLDEVTAIVRDSGETVSVKLGKEDFNRRLQKAVEVFEGKGQSIESVTSHGGNIVAKYRND